MTYHVEFRGKRKPLDFHFPDDKPMKVYAEFLKDRRKNIFQVVEGEYSIVLDFNEIAVMTGGPDPTCEAGGPSIDELPNF